MRIEKSAYEKKIECTCGCVFYASKRDFRSDGMEYTVCCPQCRHKHKMTLYEFCEIFDETRKGFGEVKIGEVRKARIDRK